MDVVTLLKKRLFRTVIINLSTFFSEPPGIVDGETSRDQIVSEGDSIILACKAKGHPVPQIR